MKAFSLTACLFTALAAASPSAAQDAAAGLLAIPHRIDRAAPGGLPDGPNPRKEPAIPIHEIPDFRGELRDIVIQLSEYARGRSPDFVVMVRGGADLLRKSKREVLWETLRGLPQAAIPEGTPQRRYIQSLDGIVVDGLYCGELAKHRQDTMVMLKPLLDEGRRLLSIDVCTGDKAAQAHRQAAADKVLLFVTADTRMAAIPPRPAQENAASYTNLTLARNAGFALASEPYDTRREWVLKLQATNHDVLVISPFHRGSEPLTAADVAGLKHKKLGSRRVVVAALPLASIRDTHLYFEKDWRLGTPAFLAAADPDLPGGYLADFRDADWKALLGRTLKGIVDLGFDGVMLGDLDAFVRLERNMPLEPPKADDEEEEQPPKRN